MASRELVVGLVVGVIGASVAAAAAPIARMRIADGSEVGFEALVEHAGAVLTVETPGGEVERLESASGIPSFGLFDARGQRRPDGIYPWELWLVPKPAQETRQGVERLGAGEAAAELARSAAARELVQSGSFTIAGGSFAVASEVELPTPLASAGDKRRATAATQVINDDLQVNGWLLLRDLSTSIRFDDTGPAGFPSNDWQLTANEFSGLNKFSIEDVTGATVPFTVMAGARDNMLVLAQSGNVGMGTTVPQRPLHIKSLVPIIRLEATQAFPPHTWELQGGPSSFSVVEFGTNLVTNPFVVASGAPAYSLVVGDRGSVGIGTYPQPTAGKLQIQSSGAGSTDAKVLVESSSTTPAARELLELRNDTGQAVAIFKDLAEAERWAAGTLSTSFIVDNQANAGIEYTFGNTGNFTAAGTITPSSSRTIKEAFSAIEPGSILAKVLALPITTWSYKADPAVRHIGPMAEDFFAAFAVGADAKGISVTDSAGVTFAAIQALHEKLVEALAAKEAEIAGLQQRLATLEAALANRPGS